MRARDGDAVATINAIPAQEEKRKKKKRKKKKKKRITHPQG